ncbi:MULTISPECIES: DUF924 family protein [unclassified Rhizobium]|uniref:DUF924 family protein n=1 Tax=unclassified Rhizobium TaxID=2613769 RepID=UPI000712AADF|nr:MULTISPECIES: DUF924 family protein [unclassified Rhizobium]KQS97989.1 hypothetical protein ASG50_22625 [Rhizobium sp. Leaf386]KQT00247.1 hypothetical protein ASG42_05215 [Rhizobium sp. Leaf391]KQT97251.1 hypothetical protein ASG68_09945 [Rhizobium sp. Leaf453]
MADTRQICTPDEVLTFWFDELRPQDWFEPTAEVDLQCDRRFRETHLALAAAISPYWRDTAAGRLAAIIVLDQIPRNIYRGTALAFATDGLALREARFALDAGADLDVPVDQRPFFYLPFEHSEYLADQVVSVKLFTELRDAEHLDFAIRHCEVIRRFGRFPHRNAALGRVSSRAEIDFLSQPGSSF